jgi:hypothetical protein
MASKFRVLHRWQEAVGKLKAVHANANSLVVLLDSADLEVYFNSAKEASAAQQTLAGQIGETVALLMDDTNSLRVRTEGRTP